MIRKILIPVFLFLALAVCGQVPLDKDLSTVKYPFEVSYHKFTSQRQQLAMAFMDVKPSPANAETVLLLHGKNFNGAYWEETINFLKAAGYRVIVPDQIGFGKSTKPVYYDYSFQQLALNTKEILDSLEIRKIIVVGHSMGGMLATRLALMYPDMISKLVLVNPIGLEDYKLFTPYQSIDSSYAAELKNTLQSYKNYQLRFYYDNQWKPEYDRWLNLLAGWTLHRDYPMVAWNAALTSDMIYTQPVVYEFQNLRCKTLLIIGTRDRTAIGKDRAPKELQSKMGLYNELGKKTRDLIAGSVLVELDGLGHLPHIEAFERFAQPLMAFLKN
ncbi:alpha/beta hydrolase [Pollutibacter soli]|uniref:alpha/beta fold hydrolase n=1 Tax=Pollutibacter soli TaxID=3034157 RepID=UPI0030137D95